MNDQVLAALWVYLTLHNNTTIIVFNSGRAAIEGVLPCMLL